MKTENRCSTDFRNIWALEVCHSAHASNITVQKLPNITFVSLKTSKRYETYLKVRDIKYLNVYRKIFQFFKTFLCFTQNIGTI